MPLPQLPAPPKAEVFSIEEILDLAKRGRLRVPHFQTELRWKAKNVIELFDSIVRGFPIGNLLLWKRSAPAERVRFGPYEVDAPDVPEALFLVDGQQRVTSLVAALLHPDEQPRGGKYAVWVDLRDGSFFVPQQPPILEHLPLRTIGDRVRLHHWARNLDAGASTESLVDRAFQLSTLISKYALPAFTVGDADTQKLRLIFSRVNTAGVQLTADQVFDALFGSDAGNPKPLVALRNEIEDATSFGKLEEAWLLRCVKAVAEISPRQDFDEETPASPEHLSRTRAALLRAIEFLQLDARIPHAKVLPYRLPLLILSKLFDLFPTLEARDRTLLVRWIWRGALSGIHSNSSHAAIAAHLGDIGGDASASIQRLLLRAPMLPGPRQDPMAAWSGHAANSRLFALVQLLQGPIDPRTQKELSMQVLREQLGEHDLGDVFRAVTNEPRSVVAERLYWPKGCGDLIDAPPEVLRSLLVDEVAADALRRGDAEGFLTQRSALLSERLHHWVQVLAAPDESDRPSIQKIISSCA